MNPLFLAFLASVSRHLLSAISGALLAIGIAQAHVTTFTSAAEPIVVGVLLYVVPQAWSFINALKKKIFEKKVELKTGMTPNG